MGASVGENGPVNAIPTMLHGCAGSAVIAVAVLLSGCASTVQGTAIRAKGADPQNMPRSRRPSSTTSC